MRHTSNINILGNNVFKKKARQGTRVYRDDSYAGRPKEDMNERVSHIDILRWIFQRQQQI